MWTPRLRGVEEEKTQDLTTSSKISLSTGSTIHGELAVGACPRAVPGLPPAPSSALAWVRAGPRAWRLASGGGHRYGTGQNFGPPHPSLAWPPPHPNAQSPTKFRPLLPGTQQGRPACPPSLSRGTFPLPIVLPQLTDKGLIPGHKLESRELCVPKTPVLARALPSEHIQSGGSQGPQWGTDRGLQEIQKRVRGIRESFLEVVAFEMSLGEQVGFEREVLRCEHLSDAGRLVQEAEGSWPGQAPRPVPLVPPLLPTRGESHSRGADSQSPAFPVPCSLSRRVGYTGRRASRVAGSPESPLCLP